MDRNQALWGGTAGRFVGMGGGVGVVREKENHCLRMQILGMVSFLRFQVCCVFGCFLVGARQLTGYRAETKGSFYRA